MRKAGFSILENLVALSLVAFILPTLMGAMILGYRASLENEVEAKSIEVSNAVFADLPSAWLGGGKLFADTYEFPSLGENESVSFLCYGDQQFRLLEYPDMPVGEGVAEQSGLVATIRYDAESKVLGSANFVLTVSGPAGKPTTARRQYVYERRFRER